MQKILDTKITKSNNCRGIDGDDSGKKAALRIAEKLFPLINEKK